MRKIALVFCLLLSLFAFPALAETTDQEIEHARQLNDQATVLHQQGKYQEAIALIQQSLMIRERGLGPDHAKTAVSLSNLATMYVTLGQYDQALPLLQRALAINEKVLGPDQLDTATTLDLNAWLYQILGQYDKALPMYQRALAIREKSLGTDHNDTAYSLSHLGSIYLELGLYDQALPMYQRALAIHEKVLGADHATTATSLNNLALLYQTLGQYDLALPLYQRALAIREQVLGSDHTDTAGSLNNLALLYEKLGQYDEALPLFQRALAILEKVLGPEHTATATGLNNLALTYQTLGQYSQALPMYQRALAIREKALGPNHADTASSLSNLASLFTELDQYDHALSIQQRALHIREETLGHNHVDTADSLCKVSELYDLLGQYEQALQLGQRALAIYEEILGLDHSDTARSLSILAGTYVELGQYEEALPLLLRAYRSSRSASVPDTLKLVQGYLGIYYVIRNNPNTAIFYLKGAVNTMQSIRAESRGLDRALQKSLLLKNDDVYNKLVDLLVEAGRLAEAQQVLSMLKEEEYFDFIRRDAQADNRSMRMNYNDIERPFAERLEKLGNDSAALVGQLDALDKQAKLGLTPEQEKRRAQIRARLNKQAKQIIALLNDIPQQLRTTKKRQLVDASNANLDQLRATLTSLGHGAALLSYIVTDTRVRIILTTPKVLLARQAEIPAKELNRKIAAFRRVLQNPALDPRPQAQALYQLLIAPVADDLKQANAQTLMLSLDGSLRYLPMGALHDGEAYLAERYPLAMYTEVAKDKLREKPGAHWKAAGFGITRKIGEFAPLPSVRQEMDGIIYTGSPKATGGVLPGDIYLDEAFTQRRLHDALTLAYPVMHIASHFQFIPGTEAQSFLLLGDGKQLTLAELRTGGWEFGSVDMITLSACETALGGGRDENGREIEGFGALVQRQGAKGVLASLWPVADQSTAILMQNLYRLRQEKGLTKADALREAQLALISGKHALPAISKKPSISGSAGTGTADAPAFTPDPARPYAHPYYWAPFILMGNWL